MPASPDRLGGRDDDRDRAAEPTRAATTAEVTIDRRMIGRRAGAPLAELCGLDRTEGPRQFAGGTFPRDSRAA